MKNQRGYFRLEYPVADRPTLVVGKHKFVVLDLSEKGCKFQLPKDLVYAPKTIIAGTVHLSTGRTVAVEGAVLRVTPALQHCVLELSVGVPLAIMMEEQRRLIQKYKS